LNELKDQAAQRSKAEESASEAGEEINEEIYNKMITSISKEWPTFDQFEGKVSLKQFQSVMIKIAKD